MFLPRIEINIVSNRLSLTPDFILSIIGRSVILSLLAARGMYALEMHAYFRNVLYKRVIINRSILDLLDLHDLEFRNETQSRVSRECANMPNASLSPTECFSLSCFTAAAISWEMIAPKIVVYPQALISFPLCRTRREMRDSSGCKIADSRSRTYSDSNSNCSPEMHSRGDASTFAS